MTAPKPPPTLSDVEKMSIAILKDGEGYFFIQRVSSDELSRDLSLYRGSFVRRYDGVNQRTLSQIKGTIHRKNLGEKVDFPDIPTNPCSETRATSS
ncbi:MAG: hypothetical protein AABX71_02915 [Nanoarchaeota archaeon]